jgi:hypothetical protein
MGEFYLAPIFDSAQTKTMTASQDLTSPNFDLEALIEGVMNSK